MSERAKIRSDTLWTPAARGENRVRRAEQEHPGSMQSFHAVLLQADVLLKLHTVVATSLLGRFHQATAAQMGYDLSRTGGSGAWGSVLRKSHERLSPFL